jgi:hypothetical protein
VGPVINIKFNFAVKKRFTTKAKKSILMGEEKSGPPRRYPWQARILSSLAGDKGTGLIFFKEEPAVNRLP